MDADCVVEGQCPLITFDLFTSFFNEILDDNFEIILKINCPVSTISVEYFPV
jgi:hypothetical protein